MVEEWDLTVCLFHAKFGGHCMADDFKNRRPTTSSGHQHGSRWDTTELNGYQDEWDGELYKTAKELFYADLERYQISESTCAGCFMVKVETAPMSARQRGARRLKKRGRGGRR
jgi:hypothetical protein